MGPLTASHSCSAWAGVGSYILVVLWWSRPQAGHSGPGVWQQHLVDSHLDEASSLSMGTGSYVPAAGSNPCLLGSWCPPCLAQEGLGVGKFSERGCRMS